MFYFEESQLNCILNTEDRFSQPDLFAEENTDIVDYFETGCGIERKLHGVSTFRDTLTSSRLHSHEGNIEQKTQNLELLQEGLWASWAPCFNGRQDRLRFCGEARTQCGKETRHCEKKTHTDDVRRAPSSKDRKEAFQDFRAAVATKGFDCRPNACCAVFGDCELGLRQNRKTGRLEWCQPCAP